MKYLKLLAVPFATTLYATTTLSFASDESACIQSLSSEFSESAPRDYFRFTNLSADTWQVKTITINLADSAGRLIFDTRQGGDGVEVFQPYKTESGSATLAKVTQPGDGATTMELAFSEFSPQQRFGFSIDVDDTLKKSSLGQIRVTGSELSGAELIVTFTSTDPSLPKPVTLKGMYGDTNIARIANKGCAH